MSLCGLNTSPSLLWVLNSSRNKVIKSTHTWLKVQVFTNNNFLSPWHSQGSHWMLNISKNQYVQMHIWNMLYQAPFCIKPLLFKDIVEFSFLNCKWDLGQPVGQYTPKCKSLFCWYSRTVWQHEDMRQEMQVTTQDMYDLGMPIFYVSFSFCSLVQRTTLNFTSLPAPTPLQKLFWKLLYFILSELRILIWWNVCRLKKQICYRKPLWLLFGY